MKTPNSGAYATIIPTLCLLLFLLAQRAGAGNSYWDINGATPGAGGATPNGSWEDPNWTTDATGSSATTTWTDGDFPIFAAGTDATGASFVVTVSGVHTIAGMQMLTPCTNVVVTGSGTLNIAAGQQGFFPNGASLGGSGLWINAVLGGAGGLINQNASYLYLYGNNTYSGGTTFAANHIVYYNNNNSFGSGPITNTATGGLSILTTNAAALSPNLPNDFWINNAGGVFNFGAGNTTCSGNWHLQSSTTLKNNGASGTIVTVSGPMTSPVGVTAALTVQTPNSGKIVLSGPNTFTGKTSVGTGAGSGTTTLSVSSINSVNGGTPLRASSSLGCPTTVANGTIALGDTTTTPGVLVYTGSGETSDRVINLAGTTAGGTLDQSGTGLLKFTSALTATGAGAKTLTLQGSTAGSGEVAGAIVNNPTTGTTKTTAAFSIGATTITLASVEGISVGAAISGTGIAGGTTVAAINTSTKVVTLSTAATGAGTNGETITVPGVVSNPTSLTKSGSGKWVLSGANTYSGNTTVSVGTLAQGAANVLPVGTGKGTFAVAAGATFDLAGYNGQINGFGTSAGIIDNTSGTATLTIGSSGSAGGTHSGVIQNTSPGVLNVTVDNCLSGVTVQFTTATGNTYSGITTVKNGVLQITAENQLGATPGSLVVNNIILDHNLGWNAGTGANSGNYYLRLQTTTTVDLTANRGIYLGTSLGYGGGMGAQSGKTLNVRGPISGPGGLWLGGGTGNAAVGTVALYNTGNTYSGGTYIVGGTLTLGDNNVLPTGTPLTMADASAAVNFDMNGKSQTIGPLTGFIAFVPQIKLTGALTIIETNNTTFVGTITGAGGSLTLDSSSTSTLVLGGTNAYPYTGLTTVNGGTLEIASTNGIASTTVTVASGATLLLDTNTALKATADLILKPGSPVVNLNFVNSTNPIHYLSFDGGATYAAPGVWSSSSASPVAPNTSAALTGTGYLSVLGAPTNTITSSQNPSVYGTAVTFTNVVSGSGPVPTGTVTFKDGATTLGTAALDGTGTATFTATNLSATTHSITAVYSGDLNYGSGGFGTAYAQVVNKATLDVSANGTLIYGQYPSNAVYTAIYYGFQGTDTVSAVTGSANFTTDATSTNYINSYVGTNYTVFFADAGTLTAANYNFADGTNGILTINPAPVTVTNVLGVTRDYDGTTNVALDFSGAGVSAFVNGDEASVSLITSNAVGAVANKNVGVGKAVTVSGLFLAGDLGTNYSLSQPTTTATISQTNITVTAAANTRTYDGTSTNVAATPTVTSGSIQTGDVANFSEAYDNKNVGLTKTLTPSGSVTDGNGGANYNVTLDAAATGEIDQLPITVTAATDTKPYDGNMSSTGVPTLTAGTIAPGDTAPAWTQSFDSPDVGARVLTPAGLVSDGNGGANYNVTYATAAGSITAIASATELVSSQNPSTNGVSVTFTATVTSGVGTPTGNVVFLTNGVPLATVPLVAGIASTNTADLPVGTNTITAQYATQDNWLGSSSNIDQVVYSSVTLSTTNALVSIVNNNDGTFTLGLLGTPGANYYIVSSGDIAAPFTAWPALAGSTNAAPGPSGQWSFVVSNAAPAFYRSIAINPAP